MGTIMDIEVKQRGSGALMDASRFITLFNRGPFDYTI